MSPTARALRTLEILRGRPGVTADQLAGRLGVTERAARRYVAILREAGIPVESVRGPYGGYRLGSGTKLPPVVFTQAEALGLVMAVLDGQTTASSADDLVEAALGKVVRALPDAVGAQAAAMREHASAAPVRHSVRPDPATTSALVAAVAAHRRVNVVYRSESGREWDVDVDPWAVVVRHGRWYLLCHSHRAEAVRTYRIDRILSVVETPHGFRPPEGLDPVATLEENLSLGWEFTTKVVFDASMSDVAPWIPQPMGRLRTLDTGCVLEGSTSNPMMYASEWLARVPLPFRVEEGPELKEAVAVVAARLTSSLADAKPATTARRGMR
jgi:predicted DNA-binding transcriptional regulator YafY